MLDLRRDDPTHAAIASLARSHGIDPHKAEAAVASIGEALSTSMINAAASRGGLADLVEILGAPGRGVYLESGTPLDAPQVRADGIGILSQLFGSKNKSRAVAARAARSSGLDVETVKDLLPSAAAVLTGALGARTKSAFGDILKIPGLDEIAREARDDLGGGGQLAPPQYGNPLPLPGEPPRRYSPSPSTDWTASTGRAPQQQPAPDSADGGMRQQSPLPVPGDDVPGMGPHKDNPYGDLSDILRRGGFRLPEGFPFPLPGGRSGGSAPQANPRPQYPADEGSVAAGGGLLANIIRSILGSVLGSGRSGSGGLISWIIRLIVMRYGAKILQGILRRILGR